MNLKIKLGFIGVFLQLFFIPFIVKAQKTDSLAYYDRVFKKFAYDYQPMDNREKQGIQLPEPPSLKGMQWKAFMFLSKNKDDRLKNYILLIFLKLDNTYEDVFKLGYSLNDSHLLVQELMKIVDFCQDIKAGEICDYIPSDLAFFYVKNHPLLLKNKQLKKQYQKALNLRKN